MLSLLQLGTWSFSKNLLKPCGVDAFLFGVCKGLTDVTSYFSFDVRALLLNTMNHEYRCLRKEACRLRKTASEKGKHSPFITALPLRLKTNPSIKSRLADGDSSEGVGPCPKVMNFLFFDDLLLGHGLRKMKMWQYESRSSFTKKNRRYHYRYSTGTDLV